MKIINKIKNVKKEINPLPYYMQKEFLPYPNIYLMDDESLGFSGGYYNIQDYHNDIIDLREQALIIINLKYNKTDEKIRSCLFHEYRHHWQYNYWDSEYDGKDINKLKGTYEEKKIEFYSTSKHELDALIFQHEYCPIPYTENLLQSIKPIISNSPGDEFRLSSKFLY